MEAIQFKGTLVYIGEIEKYTSKAGHEYVKRDIAVADDPDAKYPTVVVATLKKNQKSDNTLLVNESCKNKTCTLHFFPDGRFYTDKNGKRKAMAGNTAWKIVFDDQDSAAPAPASADDINIDPIPDDMPF